VFCTKSAIFSDNVARSLRSMANKAALALTALELASFALAPLADVEGPPSTVAAIFSFTASFSPYPFGRFGWRPTG